MIFQRNDFFNVRFSVINIKQSIYCRNNFLYNIFLLENYTQN